MTFAKPVIMAVSMMACALVAAAPSTDPRPHEPGTWHQRLAGGWAVASEATLGPGQDPVRHQSRAVARWLGGEWLVAESTGEVGGRPFTWILTLGYDPHSERFVATWIDTMQTHLWTYTGTLDDARTKLALETEGPVMGNPETTAQYREVIEITDDDHWTMRSMILGPDGQWFEFARTVFRREE